MQVVGTSPAAAMATRTVHRIHDALELAYGDFLGLPGVTRALILKVLLLHAARWPEEAAMLISKQVGPDDPHQHIRRKDNIRRFLGYGAVDPEEAIACAADRATLWGYGQLGREAANIAEVPLPICIAGQARPHEIRATLSWFTPITLGRQAYRAVRLNLLEPEKAVLTDLGVKTHSNQPDLNQSRRGTVSHRRWSDARAAALVHGDTVRLQIQREPDGGILRDADVPFALAVSIEMPGEERIYEQVRTRVAVAPRVRP